MPKMLSLQMAHHTHTEIQIHTYTYTHTEIPFSYFVIFGLFGMHANIFYIWHTTQMHTDTYAILTFCTLAYLAYMVKYTNFIFGTPHTSTCTDTQTCVHTHRYTHLYRDIDTQIQIHTDTCMLVYIHIHTHTHTNCYFKSTFKSKLAKIITLNRNLRKVLLQIHF